MGSEKPSKCVIACGGDPCPIPKENAFYIGADKGYELLFENGITPHLIVGDFDSSPFPQDFPAERVIKLPARKDDTDTVYAVKKGLEAGFSEFDIYGALGGKRISHSLANIQTLAYLGSAGAKGRLIGNSTVISLLSAGESTGCDLRGDLSVLALEAARVSIQGALYSGTFALSPSFPLGVSNRCDGKVSVSVLEGRVLVIEEQDT